MTYKILVVDDEPDLREILQCNLENAGYEVDTAESAEEALHILSPDHNLILLDVMMGGMSGYRMANKLRNELKLKTPIIFLTAKDTENDLLTGFSAGADDYISKPFSLMSPSQHTGIPCFSELTMYVIMLSKGTFKNLSCIMLSGVSNSNSSP